MKFEQINNYDGSTTTYAVCNESVVMWRKALEGMEPLDKVAGICSGGEVSFFALLPLVRKQLDLIDHSALSMHFAIGKYHAIEKLGSAKAFKFLREADKADLLALFQEGNAKLPTSFKRETPTPKINPHAYGSNAWYDWNYLHRPKSGYRTPEGVFIGADSLARILGKLSVKDFTEFRKNREKITFLHGDLDDLIERGPYDLVYLSNALDYAGRNGYNWRIKEMVRPGGFVCYTGSGARRHRDSQAYFKRTYAGPSVPPSAPRLMDPLEGSTTLFSKRGTHQEDDLGHAWQYTVVQVPA